MTDIKRYDCTNGRAQRCYGCYQMTESEYGDYVEFEEHLRIVAAKDAEIARLEKECSALAASACDGVVGDDYGHSFCRYKKELEQLHAQPARHVGGDEHVAYKQHPAIIGYARKKELAPLLDRTQPDGSYIYIGLDHPACWEEEPPYDHLEPLYIGAALAPAAVVMPEGPNYKFKFETLVEHCKRQDQVISELRYDENIRRFYDEGAVWFWCGDESDNLATLACPVVINAGDLRALLGKDGSQ